MSKYLKVSLLAMLAIAMIAGTAFAGTTSVNHLSAGANYSAALEAMGAARNVAIVGTTNASSLPTSKPIAYVLGQNLSSGNLIRMTLSGAAFKGGSAIYVCAINGGGTANIAIGSASPSANATTQSFQVGTIDAPAANVAGGNFVWFTDSADCDAAASNTFPVQLSARSSTGTATVSVDIITAGGITVDDASTATLANFAQEYSVALSSADTVTIDYLGTPGNGTRFIEDAPGGNTIAAPTANKIVITRTGYNLAAVASNATATQGGVNAGLAVNATVSFQDSASWAGINRVILMAANEIGTDPGACSNAAPSLASNSPSGTVSVAIPAARWAGATNLALTTCFQVTGSTNLATRTISGTYDINFGTGGVDTITAPSYATIQTWSLNGYQAIIPWLTLSSTVPTYCLVNNSNSASATMFMDVVTSDAAQTTTNVSLGDIAANTSLLLIFNDQGVQSQDAAGTTTTLNDLSAVSFTGSTSKRYSGKLTVAGNQNNVTMTCAQTDPVTGGKRPVPVLTGDTNVNGPQWKN